MSIIVQKFGGTSVANSYAFRKVYDIVKSTSGKRIVVLSASHGITDKLFNIIEVCLSKEGKQYEKVFEEIESHHLKLVNELFQDAEKSVHCFKSIYYILQSLWQLINGAIILEELTEKVKAEILSYGEILSSNIFYHYSLLQGENSFLLDAREIIITDNYHLKAKPNLNRIKQNGEKILKIFKTYDVVVTQGFIGNWRKETTILGRGGSDYSASLFGYSVNADEIQIWTDVDGIMTADPRVVENAKVIETISVEEVAELSFFGAKVIHPETIKPAVSKNIPLKVLNTFAQNGKGTTILQKIEDKDNSSINSLHLIEDCFFLKRKIDIYSKDIAYYLNKIEENFETIIHIGFNQNNINSVAKGCKTKNIENILTEELIEFDVLDAIALFGSNLSKANITTISKLNKIVASFSDKLANSFYLFVSNHSVVLLVKQGKGKELITKIHSILFD